MSVSLQIIIFLFSFVYGCIFSITARVNEYLIRGKSVLFRFIITLIYILNSVLIFLILLYKLNAGIFHIYFLIVFILGFYLTHNLCKKIFKFN